MLYDFKRWEKPEIKAEERSLPVFEPKWWYSPLRLDARPVAWSLRNRPDDWQWRTQGITIVHKPSNHVFWVSIGGPSLWETEGCSCSTSQRKFQRFQGFIFMSALRVWRKQSAHDPAHFAAHFVR